MGAEGVNPGLRLVNGEANLHVIALTRRNCSQLATRIVTPGVREPGYARQRSCRSPPASGSRASPRGLPSDRPCPEGQSHESSSGRTRPRRRQPRTQARRRSPRGERQRGLHGRTSPRSAARTPPPETASATARPHSTTRDGTRHGTTEQLPLPYLDTDTMGQTGTGCLHALNEETPCDPQPGESLRLKPSIPPSLPPCAPRTPPGLHPSHAEEPRSDRACVLAQPRPHRTPRG